MTTYIAMLRGINVAGQNRIKMAELKALCESLGLARVVTYVQSGNLVFDAGVAGEARVSGLIEDGISRAFGLSVQVLSRTSERWSRIIAANPFPARQGIDLAKLHVTFLAAIPTAEAIKPLGSSIDHADEFIPAGQEIYLHCPDGYGRTKFTNTFFEKKLKMAATTRNWNTVLALNELAKGQR